VAFSRAAFEDRDRYVLSADMKVTRYPGETTTQVMNR
jgi:hypothetical protein